MNTKTQNKFGAYLPLMLLLCTVACTLRTVATFLGVNAYGYFEADTLHAVSAWMLVGAILVMLTYPIAYARRRDALVRHTTSLTFVPSLLMGMTLLFFVGEKIAGLMEEKKILSIDNLALMLALVLGVLSAIYFFSLAVIESGISDRKANLGMALVLMLGVYAAYLYLNTDIPRNSHIEITEEMTFVALSLFFLYEVRISLDKQKQNLYVTFGFIAAMLCAYSAIPTLIYYVMRQRLLCSSLTMLLLVLSFLIFVSCRLYLLNSSPANAPSPFVESLIREARAREELTREVEALFAPTPEEVPTMEEVPHTEAISTADEAPVTGEFLPSEEITDSEVAPVTEEVPTTEELPAIEDIPVEQEVTVAQGGETVGNNEVSEQISDMRDEQDAFVENDDAPCAERQDDIVCSEGEREFELPDTLVSPVLLPTEENFTVSENAQENETISADEVAAQEGEHLSDNVSALEESEAENGDRENANEESQPTSNSCVQAHLFDDETEENPTPEAPQGSDASETIQENTKKENENEENFSN